MARKNSAPLPFKGQKRYMANNFIQVLKDNYSDDNIFIDLFGGSGLLSKLAKDTFKDSKVIYNDFDNYSDRINMVEQTNGILDKLRIMLKDSPRDKRLTPDKEKEVKEFLRTFEKFDYLSVSQSLLFSGRYPITQDDLFNHSFFNRIRRSNFDVENVKNFHKGLEIVSMDWHDLYNTYKDVEGVVFVADPPYFATDITSYHDGADWHMGQFLEINGALRDHEHIFFTSEKSNLIFLNNFLTENYNISFFNDPYILETKSPVNHRTSCNDYLVLSRAKKGD